MIGSAENSAQEIHSQLANQLEATFACEIVGSYVLIRTPFVFPDGDVIDLYWQNSSHGQVISDLGETYGWLFINGGNESLTAKQNRAYDDACLTYGVARDAGVLWAPVTDGQLASAVFRLSQAITMVTQTLDIRAAEATPKKITADRISRIIRPYPWSSRRNVRMSGHSNHTWNLDFLIQTPEREAWLVALYARKDRGWQQRAIEHAYAAFSDLKPVLSKQRVPAKAISVIDDTDVSWHSDPIKLLADVSEVVHLSEPDSLLYTINSNNGMAAAEI